MNNYNKNNFYDDIARGQDERYTSLKKFGIANVGTSDSSIWNGDTSVYVYPDEAITLTLTSTEAADMQDIHVYGLDANWKMQDEVITLNGTTGVDTSYEYLRVFRMKVVDGGDLTGDVSAKNSTVTYAFIDKEANQTQMAIYSVPLGYNFYVHSLDMGVLSKNAFMSMPYQKRYDIPMKINGKSDVEGRGYVDSDTDDATYEFEGYLEQVHSVPVALSSYSVTSGDEQVIVSWDAQTPAETSDLKEYEVKLYIGNDLIEKVYLTDAAGVTFSNLTNGVEYTVETNWIGYDNKKGQTFTGDATPHVPVVTGAYMLGNGMNPMGASDSHYFRTTDLGVTWDKDNFGLTDWETNQIAVIDDFSLLTLVDTSEVDAEDPKLYESTDGENWSLVSGIKGEGVWKLGDDLIMRNGGMGGNIESSPDNITWTAVTGTNGSADSNVKMGGNYYIVDNQTSIIKSSNGYTFTQMTNQPSDVGMMAASNTRLLVVYGDADPRTTLIYEYADGDVAWTSGGASTMSATGLMMYSCVYYNGLFHTTAMESDFSAGYYETSPDGVTWTNAYSNLPAGSLPLKLETDGTNLYFSLADGSFSGSVVTYNGSTYGSPVALNDGSIVITSFSGRD